MALTHTAPPATLGTMRVIEISPNAVLAGFSLLGLVFVASLGSLGALLFLAAGAAFVLRRPGLIIPEIRHYWLLLVLPLYCAASVLWSAFPDITLRLSIQLGLTFAVAIAVANRIPPATFFRILLVLYGLAALASVGMGRVRFDGAWLGVFGSKNAFAAAIGVFVLLCFAVVIDGAQRRSARLLAVAGFAAGLAMLVLAKSAGALLITLGTLAVGPLFYLSRRFTWRQRVVIVALVLLGAALAGIGVYAFRDLLFAHMLDLTGKDVTLTGRTDLWSVAFRLIAERPFFGLGYQAFWVPGVPEAEVLWAMFGIGSRSGFNFHNTYISNAVEIGIVGVAVQAAILIVALWSSVRWAFRAPSAMTVFFALFMVQMLLQSLIEVVAFFQFSIRSIIVVSIAIYATQAVRAPATMAVAARAPAHAA